MKSTKRWVALAVLAAQLSCAGYQASQLAKDAENVGQWDSAVVQYAKALSLDPTNPQYKLALARAKFEASQVHFARGKLYRQAGNPQLATIELEQTILLDPTNDYARVELGKAHEDVARFEAERDSETSLQKLKKKTHGIRAVTPLLEPASDRPINLNFPQPKPIKQIYRALADAAGINIIFDPQLKDENVSIVLTGIEFQKALETLLRQENHFYKIIDERTILIAADTPANRKTYEDLVIRTFFLSNGDVTEVANSLRALLQTTRISVNKAENSITLRDTSDKVSVAERIVEQNDKQLAEVVIDVELLQVNSAKAQELGPLLSTYSVSAGVPAPGGTTNLGAPLPSGAFSWDQLRNLATSSFGFTIPSATYFFIKNNTEAELLAKPQLRVAEGQKAQLLIGDKVPIPVTSFQSVVSGTGTGGVTSPVTSFQYQDVGIKIEVEPRVHHNKEITLKLQLEVSQLNGVAPGTTQPIIGTRTIGSNIRLKDGETNLLAGLYRKDKSVNKDLIPFIGELPVLGRLLTHDKQSNQVTDLILTLTPHIIRIPDITEADLTPVYVGTDANISYSGGPRVETPQGERGPFDQMQQQRPGARGGAAAAPVAPSQPSSPAVPASPPSDIFRQPPPPPQQVVPPQPQPRAQGQVSEKSESETAADGNLAVGTTASPASVLLDFDPANLTMAKGQQQPILVRATASAGFPGGTFVVRFDPSVVAAVVARPILGSGSGIANATIDSGRVVLEIPGSPEMTGTRAVAEITLRAIEAGRASLSFEPVELDGVSTTLSGAVIDVQ
jgi:general secretion pathway protein D